MLTAHTTPIQTEETPPPPRPLLPLHVGPTNPELPLACTIFLSRPHLQV